jgi:hypothetical protein
VQGILGAKLNCIPFHGELTNTYLKSLQLADSDIWNEKLEAIDDQQLYFWRDGESPFLIPDGVHREKSWISGECGAERIHLNDLNLSFSEIDSAEEGLLHSYPVHSFTAWVKEFRMFGFLNRLYEIESDFLRLDEEGRSLWLLVINSDILSAIEKHSPVIDLLEMGRGDIIRYTIDRSERGYEGEELLALIERVLRGESLQPLLELLAPSHRERVKARLDYLGKI